MFKKIYTFAFLVLELCSIFSAAKDSRIVGFFGWDTYIQLCGGQLSDMLSAVCNGKYKEDNRVFSAASSVSATSGVPVARKSIANRKKEGPATLCCLQFCQIKDLKAYCIDDSINGTHLIVHNKTSSISANITSTTQATTTTTTGITTSTIPNITTTAAGTTSTTTTTTTTTHKPWGKIPHDTVLNVSPYYRPALNWHHLEIYWQHMFYN